MFRLLPQYRLRTALLLLVLVAGAFAVVSSWHRNSRKAVTRVYGNSNHFNTPEWATIHILSNVFNDPIAVVIHNGKAQRQGQSFTPVKFDSRVTWKHDHITGSVKSGVWIGGVKQSLGARLVVLYSAVDSEVRCIDIDTKKQSKFLAEARQGGDPLQFVKRWVPME